ncbi:hypothetical protein KKF34_15730 [Myxococcota bacterium]|nr:hypothetical protein [Myxococcota bacterium]MBU1382214.1 hypothetical protein [Myxococcota bacterium]MBU1498326.1 hypothetical protein [Myxococcota bacterium]
MKKIIFIAVSSLFLFSCAKGGGEDTCGDGICQSDESSQTCPEDCDPCGDLVIDLDEECDGSNLDGETCQSLGFASGTLSCSQDCEFITTACQVVCENSCTQTGQQRCNGNILETCSLDTDNCYSWVLTQDCASTSLICSENNGSATCTSECTDACSQGTYQCSENMLQVCNEGTNGCLQWLDDTDCEANSQICAADGASFACMDECTDTCTQGTADQCSGSVVQECSLQVSGCYDWTTVEDCSTSGRTCSGGTCLCNNQCSAGQNQCNGTVIQNCQADSYGCYDWVDTTDCANTSQTCSGGSCINPAGTYTCTLFSTTYSPINTSGTALTTDAYADDARYAFTIPFNFNFYGTNYSGGYFVTNGWISFGSDPATNNYTNTSLPAAATPNAAIYPFWDDLTYDQSSHAGARMSYQVSGTSPNRVFILEWYHLRRVGSGSEVRLTFQVRLYETTNVFEFIYDRSNWLGTTFSATVGHENATGTVGEDFGSALSFAPSSNYRCTPN